VNRRLQDLPNPTHAQIREAFARVQAADLMGIKSIPTRYAVILIDAYLQVCLKLRALEENT
jgi:hypothetical protein